VEEKLTQSETSETAPASVSRRALLKGAAAGVLGYSLFGATRRAEASSPFARHLVGESGGVSGSWHPRFKRVRDEFVRNFEERGEVGASVSVRLFGWPIVDLWGGTANAETGEPWEKDTIVHVWSCTKGATALCAHILASRGQLDLDAPVVEYWPEFAQNGKEGATVAMMMSHQAAVPHLRDPLPEGAIYDTQFMVDRLAAEEPFWEPGMDHGYHALTFGFCVGELVRRISNRSLWDFFREEVVDPLGIDFWMGLPDSELPRLAPNIPPDPPTPPLSQFNLKALTDPTSIPALVLFNSGGYVNPGEAESPEARAQTEIGAAGGFTNARGLAGLYAPLANGGSPFVDQASFTRMCRAKSAGWDNTLCLPTRFALGYMKSMDNRRGLPGNEGAAILSKGAFGHSGFGGSIGFADPDAHMSFGYAMNKQGGGTLLEERGQALVDAAYSSLRYVEAGGNWVPHRR
jgi:CubicO group peptidase (beta-lactamase class C family)